jgi:hypothetical protein
MQLLGFHFEVGGPDGNEVSTFTDAGLSVNIWVKRQIIIK